MFAQPLHERLMARVRARDFLPQLLQRSVAEYSDDRCGQFAAAISYHVLFSLFPLAIVLAGVFGIVVHATGTRADVVDTIVRNIPLSASGDTQLRKLLKDATGNLSALGLIGVLGLVYAASGMMAAIRVALNDAWDVEQRRPFLRGKLVDVALVFVSAGLALASLGGTIALRVTGSVAGGTGALAGVLGPLVIGFVVVLFLYRVVPATDVRLGDAWPAALLVGLAFVLLENLFALYVQHFANYNAIYGSLGAVIAFMFFVYLSSNVFLFGAELASEWPRVRRRLQQEGPARGDRDDTPFRPRLLALVKGLWVRSPGGRGT